MTSLASSTFSRCYIFLENRKDKINNNNDHKDIISNCKKETFYLMLVIYQVFQLNKTQIEIRNYNFIRKRKRNESSISTHLMKTKNLNKRIPIFIS